MLKAAITIETSHNYTNAWARNTAHLCILTTCIRGQNVNHVLLMTTQKKTLLKLRNFPRATLNSVQAKAERSAAHVTTI